MYQKSQSYEVWFLRYGVRHRFFFLVLDRFLSFYPPSNLKNKNFEKKKKTLGDILILHRCAINDNHLMYGSWDIKCDGHKFLSFWTVFCPFTTLRAQKIKSKKKKMKKTLVDIIILHMCTKNNDHVSYAILFLRYGAWHRCSYFSFSAILWPFWAILFIWVPLTAQNIKIF